MGLNVWGICIMHQSFLERCTDTISGISCQSCVHPSTGNLPVAVYTALNSKHKAYVFIIETLLNALILNLYIVIYNVINHRHPILKCSCFEFMLLYKIDIYHDKTQDTV